MELKELINIINSNQGLNCEPCKEWGQNVILIFAPHSDYYFILNKLFDNLNINWNLLKDSHSNISSSFLIEII